MPHCRNCDAFVTDNYVRVFAPEGMSTVRVCPNCEGSRQATRKSRWG